MPLPVKGRNGSGLADPPQRPVVTQPPSLQEPGQFGRLGPKPIIFVLNNDGYLIERLLCKESEIAYNNVACWNYTKLPHAFGCEELLCLCVTTGAELDDALTRARRQSSRRSSERPLRRL